MKLELGKLSHLRPHTGCYKDDDESSDLHMLFLNFLLLTSSAPMKPLYANQNIENT